MVSRNRDERQGILAAPVPKQGFAQSPFMPLTLIQIQMVIERTSIPPRDRLTYAILAIHADSLGNAYARVRDIAEASGMQIETSRRILKRLRRAGHITASRIGRGHGRMSCWHLNAIRDEAPAA